jgi:hypothetical protein
MIKSGRITGGTTCSTHGGEGECIEVLVGKQEGKRPLGGEPRRENNIKTDLREVGWGCMDWIHLAWDRAQYRCCCEEGNEPSIPIKYY